jgi:hypothetical protein
MPCTIFSKIEESILSLENIFLYNVLKSFVYLQQQQKGKHFPVCFWKWEGPENGMVHRMGLDGKLI